MLVKLETQQHLPHFRKLSWRRRLLINPAACCCCLLLLEGGGGCCRCLVSCLAR